MTAPDIEIAFSHNMMDYTPEIVQAVPHEDHTVTVYFCDEKIRQVAEAAKIVIKAD